MSALARARLAQSSARQRLAPSVPPLVPPPPPHKEDEDLVPDEAPPAGESEVKEKEVGEETMLAAQKTKKPESKQEFKASEYTLTLRSGVNGVKVKQMLFEPPSSTPSHACECGFTGHPSYHRCLGMRVVTVRPSTNGSNEVRAIHLIITATVHSAPHSSLSRLLKSPTDVIL